MAEYGRRRRTLRRLWSLLSVAGTTVGVAATGASGPGVPREAVSAPMMRLQGRGTSASRNTGASGDSVDPGSTTPATLDRTPTAVGAFTADALAGLALRSAGVLAPFVLAPPPSSPSTVTTGAPASGTATLTTPTPTHLDPLVESPTTTATTTTTAPAPDVPAYQQVGDLALARLSYPWRQRLTGWSIVFLPGRPGLLGGTWTYEQRIEVYVRDSQTPEEVAFTLAHEMGHAVDVTLMSEQMRQQWKDARGIDHSVPWWVDSGATDFSSGSGDWAEAFAVWQVGGQSHTRVAPQPGAAELALLARLSGA
jgi:hypothetical protein